MTKIKTPENTQFQLVLCTCPDEETAITIAENIVAQRLAACVNVLPTVYSVYHWQDNVKTTRDKYDSLEKVITSLHPYEIPEIVAVDINSGLPEYLKWLKNSVN